jgi:hypothetical protein
MGQVIQAWSGVTAVTLSNLFDGKVDPNLTALGNLLANGQFSVGNTEGPPTVAPQAATANLQASVLKAFYGYTIPAIWTVSSANVFVIDAGYGCTSTTRDGGLQYMSASDQDSMCVCVGGNTYCLAALGSGLNNENNFGTPPGYAALGSNWGNIDIPTLVNG